HCLKNFANGIEQHYRNALGIFANGKCSNSGNAHQKELRENLAFANTLNGFFEYRQSNRSISHHVPNNSYPIGKPRLRKPIIHCDTCKQERKGNNGGKKHLENIVSTSRMRMVVSVIIAVILIMLLCTATIVVLYQILCTCFGVDFFFLCATKLFALCIVSMLMFHICFIKIDIYL